MIDFKITTRSLSIAEEILSLKDISLMKTDNNIEITYRDTGNKKHIVRLQMLTGITPVGQANKCRELLDFLNSEDAFASNKEKNSKETQQTVANKDDVITQIKKLNELKEVGALSEDEYQRKKEELLQKI